MFFTNQRRRSRSRVRRSRSRNRQQKPSKETRVQEVMKEEKPLQLTFSCQLAQGSATIQVTNFNSVSELYDKIAKGFEMNSEDIIYCTRNSTKMTDLFTGTMEQDDLLLVHMRGQPVEIELAKTKETLGVTITDNGLCRPFLKKIEAGTVAAAASPGLAVGQLIESIQRQSVLGLRHYEVAKLIRELPIGQSFVLRLINPITSGFNMLQSRNSVTSKKMTSGSGTVRFKADGAVVVQSNGPNKEMIDKMNRLFRDYIGVEDDELAQTIWDTAVGCKTLQEMFQKVRESDLQMFQFPDELVFDMWGIVSDLKNAQ